MTAQERDTRDAALFADDALTAARRVMAAPDVADLGAYYMAVFTILAVGALYPEKIAERSGAGA